MTNGNHDGLHRSHYTTVTVDRRCMAAAKQAAAEAGEHMLAFATKSLVQRTRAVLRRRDARIRREGGPTAGAGSASVPSVPHSSDVIKS